MASLWSAVIMSSPRFNGVLLDISNQLSQDQLEQLKFLMQDVIGKRERETVRSGLQLFQLLTQRGRLSAGYTDYLAPLLRDVHRPDLAEKLTSFPRHEEVEDPGPEKGRLDAATEVVVETLGRSWRKLGRRLGLKEVCLDSIASRHPTDLEETGRELLKEWRRRGGEQACTQQLLEALRGCQLNMTADKVEDSLAQLGEAE